MAWEVVYVPLLITPEEAYEIARKLEREADRLSTFQTVLSAAKYGLKDPTEWQGHSQSEFMEEFGNKPEKMQQYCAELRAAAVKARRIKVTVWVEKKVWK